jgi:hypothetical protein
VLRTFVLATIAVPIVIYGLLPYLHPSPRPADDEWLDELGSRRLTVTVAEHIQERPDLQIGEQRMAQVGVPVHLVAVAPTLLGPHEEARRNEVGHDFLGRALTDADLVRDLADPDRRLAGDAEEDVAVVRQNEPSRPSGSCLLYGRRPNHGS